MASTLLRAPTAGTFSISELVQDVADGRVRIPSFQRNYRWSPNDVLQLFDSVYRGYPIGSLLLWRRPAPADVVTIGPLRVDAPAVPDALWVVDGQQRIISLAAVLLSVGDLTDPRFSVYFDLDALRFVGGRRPPPPQWLPMSRVVDTRALLRWLADLQKTGAEDNLISAAEDVAKRIREYHVPAYIVDTADESTLRTIFDRLNTYGKSLKSAEVFQALHGARPGQTPEDLRMLRQDISRLGFGDISDNMLLRAVLGLRAPDVYRDFRNEFSQNEDPADTFKRTAAALENVIGFLRNDAEIPHVRVLPYRYVIPVLARFFALHPTPDPRSLRLLKRWVWRDALGAGKKSTSVTSLRDAVRAITEDEHGSVQRLLKSIPARQPDERNLSPRLNEARARANVAMMGSWRPRSLIDGTVIDLAALLDADPNPLSSITRERTSPSTLANRIIHPYTPSPPAQLLMESPLRYSDSTTFTETLESHCIPLDALDSLAASDMAHFVEIRTNALQQRLSATAARFAEWNANDRPPLAALYVEDDDE